MLKHNIKRRRHKQNNRLSLGAILTNLGSVQVDEAVVLKERKKYNA